MPTCETAKEKSAIDKLAAKLAADNRRIAKNLHEAAYIYALYGALDGLSLSYSMIKYMFDLLYNDTSLSSSDVMHDWMVTPAGAAVATLETLSIIACSMMANMFKDDDKDAFKRFIAIHWPYGRDAMKGLKNGYKGVRSALQAVDMLSGQDLRYMIVPVGIALGALSALNRIWLRSTRADRMSMEAANGDLLLEIQATCSLHLMLNFPEDKGEYKNSYILVDQTLCYVKSDGVIENVSLIDFDLFSKELKKNNKNNKQRLFLSKELTQNLITSHSRDGHTPTAVFDTAAACEAFRKRPIRGQSVGLRDLCLLSAGYGGVVDGLYLYMGAVGLAALAPPVFMWMMIFSALFTVMCIATRMYQEYDYQRKLVRTQIKVELALCGKELEILLATLQKLSEEISVLANEDSLASKQLEAEQEKIKTPLKEKIDEFEVKQTFLRSQGRLSYPLAALAGLENGLAAYGAIASVMFAVATINLMISAPFPPAFLIACMVSGIACLLGFLIHSLITHYLFLRAEKPQGPQPNTKLSELLMLLKHDIKLAKNLKPAEVKEAILGGMVIDPSPQFPFQEGFEVARSLSSGLAKGPKVEGFILNQLQESDSQGHYHDTSIMLWFTAFSSVVYGVGFALRAYARGFGRGNSVIDKKIPAVAVEIGPNHNERPQTPSEPSPLPPNPRRASDDEVASIFSSSGTKGTDGVLCSTPDSPSKERSSSTPQTSSFIRRALPHLFFSPSPSPSLSRPRSLSLSSLSSSVSVNDSPVVTLMSFNASPTVYAHKSIYI